VLYRRVITMKFRTLVLEGDKKADRGEGSLSAYTKQAYLRRKWQENRPPLRNRSFYLCRMIEEELRGLDLDGSGKITVCAHGDRVVPGEEPYICDQNFHVSIYYLEQPEIQALEEADEDAEPMVMWGILRKALLDIAVRSRCPAAAAERIEEAFARIAGSRFMREERIARLSKRAQNTGLSAHVYRILSAEAGEGWYLEMTDRKGTVLCRETIGGGTRYVDRLHSRLYAQSEWRGDRFVILERFGGEVFSVSAPVRPAVSAPSGLGGTACEGGPAERT